MAKAARFAVGESPFTICSSRLLWTRSAWNRESVSSARNGIPPFELPESGMDHSLTTLSAGILLFLIMDPLGNIPLFLSQLRNVAPTLHRR